MSTVFLTYSIIFSFSGCPNVSMMSAYKSTWVGMLRPHRIEKKYPNTIKALSHRLA